MSGIFGCVGQGSCLESLFYGTDYHSHLGTQYGGMAVWGDELRRKIHSIRSSQFKSKFNEEKSDLDGDKGIGAVSAAQEQPICLHSRFGSFAIVMNGWIDNSDRLAEGLLEGGHSFSEVRRGKINQTEVVAKIINTGNDVADGIEQVFKHIDGSCSMLILTEGGIYAARDRYGYTPLVLGRNGRNWAVTTESGALTNQGYEIEKYLGAGEVLFIDKDGPRVVRKAGDRCKTCSFLWIYTGFPSSCYEGINAEAVRERCGRCLARRDDIKPDLVTGVPESGVAHAVGYAMESRIPYRRSLVKYTPGYGRSYTPPTQEERDRVAKMKLIAIRDLIDGKSVCLCEDSIVRGTQLKNFTVHKFWGNGAKEVHVRPACPPLMFPCKFNISTRSADELIARRAIDALEGRHVEDVSDYLDEDGEKYGRMVEWITKDIGVTTIRYQRLSDMVEAIGLPREKLCTYCWTGKED
ncbi:MAG: amidophosphoribosyltransferase [Proteobacteria bacterium]|nr:amidophosphoribosyltransferase [Pseudomonadota bacterium]